MRDDARPNSELLVAPVADPAAQRVLLRHRPGVQIEGAALGARHLIVHERANASTRVVVHALPADGAAPEGELGAGSVIQFDEPVYTLSGGELLPFCFLVFGSRSLRSREGWKL